MSEVVRWSAILCSFPTMLESNLIYCRAFSKTLNILVPNVCISELTIIPCAGVSKSSVCLETTEQDLSVKLHEKDSEEGEGLVPPHSSPFAMGVGHPVTRGDVWGTGESSPDNAVKPSNPVEESVEEPSKFLAAPSGQTIEQPSSVEVVQEVLSDGEIAVWSKEAILQRVEKFEVEIDQVERELAKLENPDYVEVALKKSSSGPVEDLVAECLTSKDTDDTVEAMDEDAGDMPSLGGDDGKHIKMPQDTSPHLHCSASLNGVLTSTLIPVQIADLGPNSNFKVDDKALSLEVGKKSRVESIAVLEEGELNEDRGEEATSSTPDEELDSQASPASSLLHSSPGEEMVSIPMSENEDHGNFNVRMVPQGFQELASTLMDMNRKQAKGASCVFAHLLSQDLIERREKLYSCPAEAPAWQENEDSHHRNQERMVLKLTEQHQCLKFMEQVLTMRYRALKDAWRQEQLGSSQHHRGTKPVRRWEIERRNGTTPSCQRSSLRLRPVQPG